MTIPLVAVGIGNTTTKLGAFDVTSSLSDPRLDISARTTNSLVGAHGVGESTSRRGVRWRVASVHRAAAATLQRWIAEHRPEDTFLALTRHDIPLRVEVDFPDRVGMDRLTAALAAWRMHGRLGPLIVVDAGTAMTVNLVDAEGVFRGGVILPGFGLAARALADATDQLPEVVVQYIQQPEVIGRNTEAAIRSGLFWGGVGAIKEIVARVGDQVSAPAAIYVTGGDAERLTDSLPGEARFVPDLVLRGVLHAEVGAAI